MRILAFPNQRTNERKKSLDKFEAGALRAIHTPFASVLVVRRRQIVYIYFD